MDFLPTEIGNKRWKERTQNLGPGYKHNQHTCAENADYHVLNLIKLQALKIDEGSTHKFWNFDAQIMQIELKFSAKPYPIPFLVVFTMYTYILKTNKFIAGCGDVH